ncbi:DHH family phosphoesterase [Haladaptatus sp. DFWS20]|uniref:DHH family phosphoesterase n=1 Tax=Haladaptatus sp. DFWS20 TaxID=3403467 RepID=UPI003EBA9562
MGDAHTLHELLRDLDSLGIVGHTNPDPDCIASALALKQLAMHADTDDVAIFYDGEISHQQNRALINLLDIELNHISTDESVDSYSSLALVDHAHIDPEIPRAPGSEIAIIIDHHPVTDDPEATFTDIRPEYGATTSILIDYLRELELEPSSRLASTLLFALHRERLDFIRHPTLREYNAATFICPYVDIEILDQLYGSAYTPATMDAISQAIRRREVRGSSLASCIGRTSESDALPQAADYLLNLEGVNTVLVEGIVGDSVRMSARSIDPRVNIGAVLNEAFGDIGSADGHRDMARARLQLGIFADDLDDDVPLFDLLSSRVERRFFDTLRLNGEDR